MELIRVTDGWPGAGLVRKDKVECLGDGSGSDDGHSHKMEFLEREIYRYMGMGGAKRQTASPALAAAVGEISAQLLTACRVKAVSRRVALKWLPPEGADPAAISCAATVMQSGGVNAGRIVTDDRQDSVPAGVPQLCFGGQLTVHSEKLGVNLRDCGEAFLFGATLGPEADRIISRESRRDMSRALVAEAAATAIIEAYCDACQQVLAAELAGEGKHLRPRFSPGYGDFPVQCQRTLLDLLDAPRRIGLTLTEGMMLAPTKSVTAVMGIASTDEYCPPAGCEACEKADCRYRRNR